MSDGRPERVKALKDKSLPLCRRPGCKSRVKVWFKGEFYSERGYSSLGCLLLDYSTRGMEAVREARGSLKED